MNKPSFDLLSTVLETITSGITVQNAQGKIIYANNSALKMIGYPSLPSLMRSPPASVLKNFHIMDLKGKTLDPELLPGRIALRDGKSSQVVVKYIDVKNNHLHWAQIKAVPVFDKEGIVEYVVNTFQDITKEIQENESIDHFISTASHELKTPLAGIKALNQLVEKFSREGDLHRAIPFFPKIDEKVNELTKIINDFLDSTKIRQGTLDFNPELFDFDQFMEQVTKDMQRIIHSHTIIREGKIGKNIVADKNRIRQVFTNLISNARKYSPKANQIIVKAVLEKNKILISIQDFGIGIAKIDQSNIFKPYFRSRKKYTGTIGGLGLGLYISSHIVSMHNGKMWVDSKVGHGSTFFFTLPLLPHKNLSNSHF